MTASMVSRGTVGSTGPLSITAETTETSMQVTENVRIRVP